MMKSRRSNPGERRRDPGTVLPSSLLHAFEQFGATADLDDCLESFLGKILEVDRVAKAEIYLCNKKNDLVRVADGVNVRSEGATTRKVHVESWLLNGIGNQTVRKNRSPKLTAVLSIPLIDSMSLIGLLVIATDCIVISDAIDFNKLRLYAGQLSLHMKNAMLALEVSELRDDLKTAQANNTELLGHVATLSKELYAITAISTKINKSLNFQRSLKTTIATLRTMFGASVVSIYVKDPRKHNMRWVSYPSDRDERQVQSELVAEVEETFLPSLLEPKFSSLSGRPREFKSEKSINASDSLRITGIQLKGKEETLGAIVVYSRQENRISTDGLRLLSGIASIMAMSLEGMILYRKSEVSKSNAAFLAGSIARFNRDLDLRATLNAVAERGAVFAGTNGHALLETKFDDRVVACGYSDQSGERRLDLQMIPGQHALAVKAFLRRAAPSTGAMLSRSLENCDGVDVDTEAVMSQLGIQAILAIPLEVRGQRIGTLAFSPGTKKVLFNYEDIAIAEGICNSAAIAIDHARAYTESLEHSDQLETEVTARDQQLTLIREKQQARVEEEAEIIFWVNARYRIVFVNRTMEILSGRPRGELCLADLKSEQIIHEHDREAVFGAFQRVLTGEASAVRGLEYRHLESGGRERLISLTVYPAKDLSGQVIGLEAIGRDVTDRKKLEAELARAKELALLGEFSGAVAHQIRNPLVNILMGTKLLQHELGFRDGESRPPNYRFGEEADNAKLESIFSNLLCGIDNLNHVVTQLLNYTKALKLAFSAQQVAHVLRDGLRLFENIINQRSIRVKELIDPAVPPVYLDAVLIGSVLQNLVDNALYAMPEGGCLTLAAAPYQQRPGYVLVSVCDTGIGVDPEALNKLFRPFYTTKDCGTGLGLSVAHRIVEAHGGSIWACTNPCRHLTGFDDAKADGDFPPKRGLTVHMLLPASQVHRPS
ncbi:MAG: PAS domain S-box protein [Deltaproteobacteria bacterium]|nr:PAS domain S-box protein [Deltaproteobacteria bacterium]